MLRGMKDLHDCAILATDGAIGQVQDFYFDDEAWVIRYLVVDTGSWLSNRKVLISPIAIANPNWKEKILPVSITKEQVQNSPDIDTDKPVSRQHEIQYFGYFGFPYYWGGAGLWGGGIYPGMLLTGYPGFGVAHGGVRTEAEEANVRAEMALHENDDPHLRSCKAVEGYHIQATDGDIGHVQSLLVDAETWSIRYLVVNTSNWWLGHRVLIAPQWISEVSWAEASVSVKLTRQTVKDSPTYDPAVQLDRDQELAIYKHYGRSGYWEDGN